MIGLPMAGVGQSFSVFQEQYTQGFSPLRFFLNHNRKELTMAAKKKAKKKAAKKKK